MSFFRRSRRGKLQLALLAAISLLCAGMGRAQEPPAEPAGKWRDASMQEYKQHLEKLTTLTQACAKGRDLAHCDPMLVGDDDRVPLGNGANASRRLIRYGWLRVLFVRGEETDEAQKAPGKPTDAGAPSTSKLLQDAQDRLANDLQQADQPPAPLPAHDAERAQLKQVLAQKEFRNLKRPDEKDTAMERFQLWLNHLFAGLGGLQAKSAWVGRALVWGFVLAVATGLAWTLIRMERRWRVRLVPEMDGPAPGAASARDWQLWMADARAAAAREEWRAAIHFLYWAAISRLESKRLWPADRARTPREYLAMVARDDARHLQLRALTAVFERTWYGGRDAGEGDYRGAEEIAAALIAGHAPPGIAAPKPLPEGEAA